LGNTDSAVSADSASRPFPKWNGGQDCITGMDLPCPEGYGRVRIHVMMLRAGAFLAEIDVLAPLAVDELAFLPDRTANRAGFKEFGDDVARVCPPVVHGVVLFANAGKILFAHHIPPPRLAALFDATQGPCESRWDGFQLSTLE
jgi:hypothetical protein